MGLEVEAAAAEAARVEKRLRADVDHSLQQLATELNTETELRTKRHTELASDVSQLHSQVCVCVLLSHTLFPRDVPGVRCGGHGWTAGLRGRIHGLRDVACRRTS